MLNKVNKSATGTSDQMVVNIPNFPNVQLSNQNLSISLPGMTNNIPPITSSVMTNNLNTSCKQFFYFYEKCIIIKNIRNSSLVSHHWLQSCVFCTKKCTQITDQIYHIISKQKNGLSNIFKNEIFAFGLYENSKIIIIDLKICMRC